MHFAELKAAGFAKELREEIKQTKTSQKQLLDGNISAQRAQFQSALPGMCEDLNEVIRNP